jgi:hypothetical protein
MSKKRACFVFLGLAAVAWTAYLAWLAHTVADPIVVSAPQLYYAPLVVVAEVRVEHQGLARATIRKIYKDDLQAHRSGPLPLEITVHWLATFPQSSVADQFLLALRPAAGEGSVYDAVPVPVPPTRVHPDGFLPPRTYPYTESIRLQVEQILKMP